MTHLPRFQPVLCAALTALLPLPAALTAETVLVDNFADGNVRSADTMPNFWDITLPAGNPDSQAVENRGALNLRAATWPHTYAGLVSLAMDDFGFFKRPLTVTLEDITLEAKGIPDGDARFKISLTSTQDRAEKADDAISIRIRKGLLLLGYRVDGFDANTSPENLSGQRANSVLVQELDGTPAKLSLTLGPSQNPGVIRYEIRAEGNGINLTRSGLIPLTLEQWGGLDAASLVIDARRDNPAAQAGTHTDFSVGRITVTR
ncbi:MAG: hypothetical protein ABII82_11820 [Verrucomicrobiota bacterium]